MEEQLSGSCTVEIAAFNQFSDFITDREKQERYDHILFDTAPTGHTLRMLQLPSAWSAFINESTHGASCLGQLSGLEERKGIYQQAVKTLARSGDYTSGACQPSGQIAFAGGGTFFPRVAIAGYRESILDNQRYIATSGRAG